MKISPRTAALANMSHWRANQGAKIKANRPIEVYRACDHAAQLIAHVRDPLILNADEIKTCVHRAISQERRRQHGALGKDPDEWWSQIEAIARRWNIPTTQADWQSTTKAQEAA